MTRKTYRAKEIAQKFGIALSTVWKYSKENKITAIKISRKLTLFNAEEVDNFFLG